MHLSEYLIENNLTQQNFADMLNVSQPTVSKWLQGLTRPSWEVIKLITEETEGAVTANDFLVLPYMDETG